MLKKNLYFSNTNKKKIIESLISNSEGPILRDVCMNINEMDEEMGSKVFFLFLTKLVKLKLLMKMLDISLFQDFSDSPEAKIPFPFY